MSKPYRVLMVCMGNICRSPTAEGVLRHKLKAAGLDGLVEVDSAGTHADWHKGHPPDPRSVAHARKRGYDLTALRARMVTSADFERHDLILVMDDDNWAVVQERCLPEHRAKLGRLGDHGREKAAEIPDPYYGPPVDSTACWTSWKRRATASSNALPPKSASGEGNFPRRSRPKK